MYQSGMSINNPDPYVNMNLKALTSGINERKIYLPLEKYWYEAL
jgi:hypothetical protein